MTWGCGEGPARDPSAARTIGAATLRGTCAIECRVVAASGSPYRPYDLDVIVQDPTGTMLCQFTGRRGLPGVRPGVRLRVEGTVVDFRSRRCLLNPSYELLGDGDASS